MYTLKGIFPEPKKEQKKNFIKENKKQLKYLQAKIPIEPPKFTLRTVHPPARLSKPGLSGNTLNQAKSIPLQASSKSGKNLLNSVPKTSSISSCKKCPEVKIKKGDMAEFLKRKELRQSQVQPGPAHDIQESEPTSHLRDMACQTLESELSLRFAKSTKLTTLYPRTDEESDCKVKASGDTSRHQTSSPNLPPQKSGDSDLFEAEKRSRLNAILERKDPYLPPGYQKGVVPKYLRERKEQELKEPEPGAGVTDCPAGHVTLPDVERKETLRMLRSSFAELVSELNKMPVKTDTLRMRNRKMELEKQLSKLEEGIKVFSRPKVFVKIGE